MRGGLGCEAAVGGTRREGAWVTVGGGRRRRVECDEVEMREVFCCRGRGAATGKGVVLTDARRLVLPGGLRG